MGTQLLNGWRELPKALKWLLIAGLMCHFGFSFFYAVAHYFIPDEMVYLMMNESLAKGKLALDSGYDQYKTPMFIFGLSILHNGEVFAQYPAIYSFISMPFYMIAGKSGLVFINQLCFAIICLLIYRIQKLLFDSDFSAWAAVCLAALGGYLWPYSQVIAPHLLQIALLMTAAWLMLRALFDKSGCVKMDYLLCGLLFGIALGVRLDSLFALPMLVLPLLFARPIRWNALALLLPGLLLSLAVLAYINHIKFGTWSPITYDAANPNGNIAIKPMYFMLAGFGLLVIVSAWVLSRLDMVGRLPKMKWLALIVTAVLAGLAIFATPWLAKLIYGFILTVVDYSTLPADAPIAASASRTESGGFLYLGEYKRALLQSAPFIAMLSLLPLAHKLKLTRRDGVSLLWLALLPMVFVFFFSMTAWHGGFAYHMRYYTPTLPFFAMMAAQIFSRLLDKYDLKNSVSDWLSPLAFGAVVSVLAVLYADAAGAATREWMLLVLPLWMWLAVMMVAVMAFYDGAGKFVRQLAVMVCSFAMFWGAGSTLLVVFPHLNSYKTHLEEMSSSYEPYIDEKAVVISVPRYFTGFVGRQDRKLYIATIFSDGEKVTKGNMRGMIEHFLKKDHSVYITHDMRSLPIIRKELSHWGMKEVLVRGRDKATNTPPLSKFVFSERAAK